MRFLSLLALSSALALAQMPYQVGWVYVTSTLDSTNMTVSAVTVAETGGTAGHTVKAVVKMTTPDSRVSYGTSGWDYHSESYTSASLCSGECYGGLYQVTSYETEEYCPIADAYVMAWEETADKNPPPFMYVSSVAWSPSSAKYRNAQSTFTINVGKSVDCTATSAGLQMNFFAPVPPQTPSLGYSVTPSGTSAQTIAFAGSNTVTASWTITTAGNNDYLGSVATDGLISNSGACTVTGTNPKSTPLTLQP